LWQGHGNACFGILELPGYDLFVIGGTKFCIYHAQFRLQCSGIICKRIVHRVDLAEIYSDLGQSARARGEYETVLRLGATDVNDPHYKAQAKRALAGG
jgi:hypothetical protein